jgi:hypothetical protein
LNTTYSRVLGWGGGMFLSVDILSTVATLLDRAFKRHGARFLVPYLGS